MELSKDEQNIMNYFRDNKRKLSNVLLAVLLIIAGIKYWSHHKTVQANRAASIYQAILQALSEKEYQTVITKGESLSKFRASPYFALSGLILAKVAIEQQDFQMAEQRLNYVLENYKGDLVHSIKLRLARVKLFLEKPSEALQLLSNYPKSYAGMYEELKGDIYRSLGDSTKARQAYQLAQNTKLEELDNQLLELKLADIDEEGN